MTESVSLVSSTACELRGNRPYWGFARLVAGTCGMPTGPSEFLESAGSQAKHIREEPGMAGRPRTPGTLCCRVSMPLQPASRPPLPRRKVERGDKRGEIAPG